MQILRLADCPERAAETAALMLWTWPDHYGPTGPGDAASDVASRIAEDRAAVAVRDDAVIGTVALAEQSFGSEGEGPWLVGLCTDPALRGQGVASALTTWAMGKAHADGHRALFTTTRDAKGIVSRLGWQKLRDMTTDTGVWSIWRITL